MFHQTFPQEISFLLIIKVHNLPPSKNFCNSPKFPWTMSACPRLFPCLNEDECTLTKHSRCWTYSALRYFHYPIYRVYGYKWKMCTGSWDIDLNLRINLKCNQNWGTFWLVFLHIVKVIVALNLIFYKTDIVENFTPNLIYNFFQSYHQSSLSLCFIHCTFHIYDIQPQHRGGLAQ